VVAIVDARVVAFWMEVVDVALVALLVVVVSWTVVDDSFLGCRQTQPETKTSKTNSVKSLIVNELIARVKNNLR